jgi:hypothetical protein
VSTTSSGLVDDLEMRPGILRKSQERFALRQINELGTGTNARDRSNCVFAVLWVAGANILHGKFYG